MTTPLTQSEFDLPIVAAQNSEASKIYVQITDPDGSVRVVERNSAVSGTVRPCKVVHITPVAEPKSSADFDDFDALAREVAADSEASEAVRLGRKLLAQHQGSGDLASLRLAAGLSQTQLAAACGIEQPHVSRYESGKTEPLMTVCRKLASALNVSMEQFEQAWLKSREASLKVTQ